MNQTGARDDARCWPGPEGTRREIVRGVACTMRTSAGAFRASGGGPTLWGLHGSHRRTDSGRRALGTSPFRTRAHPE